jgi:hypothetical protein
MLSLLRWRKFSLASAGPAPSENMNEREKQLVARLIAHLTQQGFIDFVGELFANDGNYEGLTPLAHIGSDVFYRPFLDSYGGSIHEILLFHFPPLELFRPSLKLTMNDPVLIKRLGMIRHHYHGREGSWGMVDPFLKKDDALHSIKFITNFVGLPRAAYADLLIPAYQRIKRYCGLKKPRTFVGSCDSFVDLNSDGAEAALRKVVSNPADGVVVSVSEHDVDVANFSTEKFLGSGVSKRTHSAYEPVIVSTAIRNQAILETFTKLIHADTSEKQLEEFLVTHFKEIFGAKFDRIETQLWLRFPELDIEKKNRRLDMFLRNSIRNDWECFEIKRPVQLTATYRDAPAITRALSDAIHQARNYGRLLTQDKVKRYFADEGIHYYEPVINLVIGRTPQIPHEQWRWLQKENEDRIRIFTFDELLIEMKCRFEDRYAILESLL